MERDSTVAQAKPIDFRKESPAGDGLVLRAPTAEDGYRVHDLIANCKPLDENSLYCNLLQCSDFQDTCAIAEKDGEVIGFLSGYCPPKKPDTFFVWQVAVSEKARGLGLARRMMLDIVSRHKDVKFIEATITEDNEASWALFKGTAKKLDTEFQSFPRFDRERHFNGRHDSEFAIKIGPFAVQ